ncbi:hypothetical protein SME36J_34690 [Serratia marcescens]|nr:hypothetical protein SME36J_34690 [Serratia marcescens]
MSDITVTANPTPTNDAGGITGAPFNQHDPQPSALQENEDQYYNGETYLPGTDDLDEAVFDNLFFHEGSITHMYMDTTGHVTIGIGTMLPNVQAAQAVPFISAGNASTPQQIEAEYNRVAAIGPGYTAQHYQQGATMGISPNTVRSLAQSHVNDDRNYLRGMYPEFDSFPLSVKVALHDIIYTVGPTRLRNGFPSFNNAINSKNWSEAAKESNRKDVGAGRNRNTRRQLLTGNQ